MPPQGKVNKLSNIYKAAEYSFVKYGYQNAKMEDIAKRAGIVKVTLYSYVQSKENLYMALTYRCFQELNERFYFVEQKLERKSGLDCVMNLAMEFV